MAEPAVGGARVAFSKLDDGVQDELSRRARINDFADPAVGEGYTIVTESDWPGFNDGDMPVWNFHWAAVLAVDGTDRLTIEGYQDGRQRATDNWQLALYNTEKQGQTFNDDHGETGTHGSNFSTFRVRLVED